MKIIETGTPPENKIYRITCPTCLTVFEIERKEAKVGETGHYLHIGCPTCGRICYIDMDEKYR